METTQYELKSKPGTTISVPAEWASKAEQLVTLALEDRVGLDDVVSEHPCLRDERILQRAIELARTKSGTPESLLLQDILYLRVCSYKNDQGGLELDEEKNFDIWLSEIVPDLEDQYLHMLG